VVTTSPRTRSYDDPNDRIPHEARRDLRGLLAIDTWLDAVDVTEGQFVDSWVEDPAVKGRHYVVHYAVDFGKSMGAMGDIDHDWWRVYRVDTVRADYAGTTYVHVARDPATKTFRLIGIWRP
jgi:hypothetical protein